MEALCIGLALATLRASLRCLSWVVTAKRDVVLSSARIVRISSGLGASAGPATEATKETEARTRFAREVHPRDLELPMAAHGETLWR